MGELKRLSSEEEAGLEHLAGAIRTVRRYLARLRKLVEERGFLGAEEEIRFFKEVKPRFYQWWIFYTERVALEAGAPLLGAERVQQYWAEQLEGIDRFFARHVFHYRYYRLGAGEMDRLYFLRGAEVQEVLIPEVPEVDPQFGTRMEYLFSKFRGYEHLAEYIAGRMGLSDPMAGHARGAAGKGGGLKWTGETSNLIELAYGLHETGQINEGKADISEIILWLEQGLSVSLGRYYRRFTEIKRRKRISKTRFLEEMREAVARRIDEGDAFLPKKNRCSGGNRAVF